MFESNAKTASLSPSKTLSEASLILIKAIKCAKKFLKIQEPLYIYDENGEYTNQIKNIYNQIKY